MVEILKQFKAILWKQYRQAFSMIIGASVVGFIVAWVWAYKDPYSFQAFYAWQGIIKISKPPAMLGDSQSLTFPGL